MVWMIVGITFNRGGNGRWNLLADLCLFVSSHSCLLEIKWTNVPSCTGKWICPCLSDSKTHLAGLTNSGWMMDVEPKEERTKTIAPITEVCVKSCKESPLPRQEVAGVGLIHHGLAVAEDQPSAASLCIKGHNSPQYKGWGESMCFGARPCFRSRLCH